MSLLEILKNHLLLYATFTHCSKTEKKIHLRELGSVISYQF